MVVFFVFGLSPEMYELEEEMCVSSAKPHHDPISRFCLSPQQFHHHFALWKGHPLSGLVSKLSLTSSAQTVQALFCFSFI